MNPHDETAYHDALSMLRKLQAQRHKLTLKRNKTEKDFIKLERLLESEADIYETLRDIDPDFLQD